MLERADGRTQRSVKTKAAVVDALLELIEEGDLRPPAPRIAERAGVSLRSVFQHFRDLEALFAIAADRQLERIMDIAKSIPATAPSTTASPRSSANGPASTRPSPPCGGQH